MHEPLATISKIRLRVIAPLALLLVISSLDRANLSFAALQMNRALGLSPSAYGLAVSVFFVGYLLFQFPSMYLLHKLGARAWITGSVLLWGGVALAMAFVDSAAWLYVLRCLLGVAEAGFAPGVVYLCSRWMPKQYRAAAISMTMLAVPISVIAGGPFSGWLMAIDNPLGMAGWRWMFAAEGVLTLVVAVLAWRMVVDTPDQARWLSGEERRWLARAIASDDAAADVPGERTVSLWRQPALWAASGVWFVLIAGAYGILFWLPQIARQLATGSEFRIGLISAVPWIGIGLGMFFNARHSDRSGERFRHVMLPLLVCSACLVLATLPASGAAALGFLFVAGLGLGGAQGVFWTIPTGFLGKDGARQGITLINFCGNLGGLFGPFAIGLVRQQTGSFTLPIYAMALLLLGGALLMLRLRPTGSGALAHAAAREV